MRAGLRRVAGRWGLLLLAAAGGGTPDGAAAQETGPAGAAVAVLVPDTVRVGEPVTLGISVRATMEPAFPAVLALPEDLEQLGPPRVGRTGDGAWRAAYRLAAWRTGAQRFLPVTVTRDDGVPVVVTPPDLVVESVLPAEGDLLSLRPPRMPGGGPGIPWARLLAALLAAVLVGVWALRRFRSRRPGVVSRPSPVAGDPLEEARAGVSALKVAVDEGRLAPAAFYDGLEALLRRYLARARGRPSGLPVRGLADDPRAASAAAPPDLAVLVTRALPARFGALAVGPDALLSDADAVLAWLDAEEAA